jgi:hypothetical protein
MKALRLVLIIVLGFLFIPSVLRLLLNALALAKDVSNGATNAGFLLGQLVGTALFCLLLGWIIKYLWNKNKSGKTPPPLR